MDLENNYVFLKKIYFKISYFQIYETFKRLIESYLFEI